MHPQETTIRLDVDAGGEELSLIVVSGAECAPYPVLEGDEITIGRAPENDWVIDVPSLSRRHARLLTEPTLRIIDLDSANGVKVGGKRIAAGTAVPLSVGHVLSLGDVSVVVQRVRVEPEDERGPGEGRIVCNATMHELYALAERVAKSELSVLVCGETGTGKELIAEFVHERSQRAAGPLLRLNCAAIAENLVESELFGHEAGAFTGAERAMPGLLESASGGTVFLDEVGDLPLGAQAKLLRALESREVRRVGARVPVAVDVRFVAATHRDLKVESDAGRFRQDLYFRLNGITLQVPPLRDRRDEIEPLARAFARRYSDSVPVIADEVMGALCAYAWPGNVRELRNIMERMTVLAGDKTIAMEHLPREIRGAGTPKSGATLRTELESIERQRIVDALEQCEGNQSRAAEMLGMARRTLLKRLDQYEIPRPRKR